jgi:hypothetical protein
MVHMYIVTNTTILNTTHYIKYEIKNVYYTILFVVFFNFKYHNILTVELNVN